MTLYVWLYKSKYTMFEFIIIIAIWNILLMNNLYDLWNVLVIYVYRIYMV